MPAVVSLEPVAQQRQRIEEQRASGREDDSEDRRSVMSRLFSQRRLVVETQAEIVCLPPSVRGEPKVGLAVSAGLAAEAEMTVQASRAL